MENSSTINLNQLIINDKFDKKDLYKLAELNKIEIQTKKGWNNLLIALILELDQNGWDKKVSSIKEKYGSLRFYTNPIFFKIVEKYSEKSKITCEICGKEGRQLIENSCIKVRCQLHK